MKQLTSDELLSNDRRGKFNLGFWRKNFYMVQKIGTRDSNQRPQV